MLPILKDQSVNFMLMQNRWASQLNPVLALPILNGNLIKGVVLKNGATVINHLLSRQMVGWYVVDINAAANIYRSQPLNDLTLTLTSNAAVTVNLWVF